jgi:hypothetical protein
MKTLVLMMMPAVVVGGLAGCNSSELETGYVPRKLGGNPMARRGYYAAPFTPEAQAAQAVNGALDDGGVRDLRRPGGVR